MAPFRLLMVIVICTVFSGDGIQAKAFGQATGTSADELSYSGRQFVVPPGLTEQHGHQYTKCIIVMALTSVYVRVRITTPRLMPPVIDADFDLAMGDIKYIDVPRVLSVQEFGTSNNIITVRSDKDIIVTIESSLYKQAGTELLQTLPTPWAGTRYVIPGERQNGVDVLLVTALQDDTVITVYRMPTSWKCSSTPITASSSHVIYTVRGQRKYINLGEDFSIRLSRYEMFYVKSGGFCGYQVISTRPILVMVVPSVTSAAQGQKQPHAPSSGPTSWMFYKHLLPVSLMSSQYIALGIKGHLSIASHVANFTVNARDCSSSTKTVTHVNGCFFKINVQEGCGVEIVTSSPVHVLQYISTADLPRGFVLNILPVEQLVNSYTFLVTEFNDTNTDNVIEIHVLINLTEIGGLYVLPNETFTQSRPDEVSRIGSYGHYKYTMNGLEGRITISHNAGIRFAVYSFGKIQNSLFLSTISAGRGQHKWRCTKNLPMPRRGDRLDNDCDNSTDEERTFKSDDDQDGAVGEDVASNSAVNGQWSTWGSWLCSSLRCNSTDINARIRSCNSPPPSPGGDTCPGEQYQTDGIWTRYNQRKCPIKSWGSDCTKTCPVSCLNGLCHPSDGYCTNNCSVGYRGLRCELPCALGTYGRDCKRMCFNRCQHVKCNTHTGHCEGDKYVRTIIIVYPAFLFCIMLVIVFTYKFLRSNSHLTMLMMIRVKTELLVEETRKLSKHSSSNYKHPKSTSTKKVPKKSSAKLPKTGKTLAELYERIK